MKFGVRQICNVVFRAKNNQKIGDKSFVKGQPVFYLDSAKTSTLEGAATTVYATGGRGNTRLIAWEGERTLTFTVEDALISPVSFAMLSGAGVVKGKDDEVVHFHQTTAAIIDETETTQSETTVKTWTIDLHDALIGSEKICPTAPIYVMKIDEGGDLTGEIMTGFRVGTTDSAETGGPKAYQYLTVKSTDTNPAPSANIKAGAVIVDYYVKKAADTVTELQIDAETFGGYYYVEADTLFRRQYDGKDLPANITLPNVKIQSNFTFSMAATGDPSTFTFTMDAMPGYTYFDTTKKVLCAIQYTDDNAEVENDRETVFPHPAKTTDKKIIESQYDSVFGYTGSSSDETGGEDDQKPSSN